jgi:superfamily II DNA or RNA helicase
VSYTLRPYQAHAVERSVQFLRNGREQGGLVVLPTGSGKSW